jgi:hypothetical protein
MMKGLMEQMGTMLRLLKTPVSKMALIAIQLKIVLWNNDGLAQHAEEVKAYTQNEKVDIMLIYETHFTKKKKIASKFPNTQSTAYTIPMVLNVEEPQSLLKLALNITFMGTITWNIYKQLASP